MWRKLRWKLAAVVAFLMGAPFVAEARAQDGWDIAAAAIGLGLAIADAS
jgi:hypothetical protein